MDEYLGISDDDKHVNFGAVTNCFTACNLRNTRICKRMPIGQTPVAGREGIG